MALPKIIAPEFETTIPSTKQKITFRPFLVKEEKLLFMAAESATSVDISRAIVTILENCITSEFDVDTLSGFDVEFLFLQLRSKSVGEAIKLHLSHTSESECKYVQEYEVDINSITIQEVDGHTNILQLTDKIGMEMRYPGVKDIVQAENIATAANAEEMFKFAIRGIVQVYDGDDVYDEFTEEELMDFVESLSTAQFQKILDFYDTMPKLRHTIEWTCPECQVEESSTVEGLAGFFT